MNCRIRKEFRENLPVVAMLALAMGLGVLKPFDPDSGRALVVIPLIFGSGYLGAMPLVRELEINDGSWFVAQPVPRNRLWWEKFLPAFACWIVLALCFAVCSSAVFSSSNGRVFEVNLAWMCAAIFCAGPLAALLGRRAWPALLLACSSPFPVMLTIAVLQGVFSVVLTSVCNAAVGLTVLFLGYRVFRRCEAAPTFMTRAVHLSIPRSFGESNESRSIERDSRAHRPFIALIRKEVRLTLPSVAISVFMSALMTFIFLFGHGLLKDSMIEGMGVFFLGGQIAVMPGLAAVALVAGDHAVGVREQLMSAPFPVRTQWALKLGAAFAASWLIVLGALAAMAFSNFSNDGEMFRPMGTAAALGLASQSSV